MGGKPMPSDARIMLPRMNNADLLPAIVRGITPRLKGKIVKRGQREGISMRAVVRQVISDHYGVEYDYDDETSRAQRTERYDAARSDIVTMVPRKVMALVKHEKLAAEMRG